ncbi:5705_t:CDS:2, partial [Racocetra fulgida]
MSQIGNGQRNGSQNGERPERTDNNGEPSSAELIQQLITGLDQ